MTLLVTNQEINEAVEKKLGLSTSIPWAHKNYAGDLEAALEIVESLKDKYFWEIQKGPFSPYRCSVLWMEGHRVDFVVVEHADTAPLAICKAFLKIPSDEKQ